MKSTIISTTADSISSGGSITGDLTISGDLTVEGSGTYTYDEQIDGQVWIKDSTASSATQGGHLRLFSDDGAALGDTHRLGVLEFGAAEDTSSTITIGARIEAIADAAWSASENGADMVFYTTDGDAAQSEIMRLSAGKTATFTGSVTVNKTLGIERQGAVGNLHTIIGTANDLVVGVNGSAGDFIINTVSGTTERFRIQGDTGNVGIGTTSPSNNLHIEADAGDEGITIHAAGDTSNAVILDANRSGAGSGLGGIIGKWNGTSVGYMTIISGDDTGNKDNGEIVFATAAAGSPTERMRIDSSGNVGIGAAPAGASTPSLGASKLEVHGGAYNTSLLIKGSGANSGITFVDSGGVVDGYVYAAAETVGFLDAGGSWMVACENDTSITFSIQDANKMKLDANSRISLSNNDSGSQNTIFGYLAGEDIASGGTNNTLIGHNVGKEITTADGIVGIGHGALIGGISSNAEFTVAIGTSALAALTSGAGNVAIGYQAGLAITTGERNTVLGHEAFDAANREENYNVAIGAGAMGSVDEGSNDGVGTSNSDGNIAIGYNALLGGDMGDFDDSSHRYFVENIAIGYAAMDNTTTNDSIGQIAIGSSALGGLTSGGDNVAIGYNAGLAISTGNANVALGRKAMVDIVEGSNNIAIGDAAFGGLLDTTADASTDNIFIGTSAGGGAWVTAASNYNVGIGNYCMDAAMNGASRNTAVGHQALSSITTGDANVAIGSSAGDDITVGISNVNIGNYAGHYMVDSSHSVVIGAGAGSSAVNYIGDYCILIGSSADVSTGAAQNQIVIGYDASGVGDNTAIIGNASCADVYMGDDGNAWSQVSDERLKRNIEDWDVGLDAINKLKIRQFQFKDDNPFGFTSDKVRQGVVAQEAIEALPEMIRTNEEGWMSANNESMIWAMVNAIQELSAEVESLKEQLNS